MTLVLSCEHGGCQIPGAYRRELCIEPRVLASHAGWDQGALQLARQLASKHAAPLVACTTTRLLLDLNRSLGHPKLFSSYARGLSMAQREALTRRYWHSHRESLLDLIQAEQGAIVLHLSVHSFTPRWQGRTRQMDIGMLYDPGRPNERSFVAAWRERLQERNQRLRIRRNQPYRGTSDGLTTAFRKRFPNQKYMGIELEVSQRFPRGQAEPWKRLRSDISLSLGQALTDFHSNR